MRFYQRFFFSAKGCQKIPSTRIFIRKNQSLHYRGKCPAQGFFLKVNNFSTTVEKSILAQYPHPGKSEEFKLLPHHSTAPPHMGTLKKIKLSTPHHRAHTHGNFEKFQSLHTTPQSPHTVEKPGKN